MANIFNSGELPMLTRDEHKQIQNFQDAVAGLIDQYLKEGIAPEWCVQVLVDEADSVNERHKELQSVSG